ncbi:P-loop containing nucleoside triphosphate hydrolase protein [Marasmius fiardii PR-910]|nr:P-loop containing nucleoside triphosphate hydrolase protein [Marasmius fiardii PR-910]
MARQARNLTASDGDSLKENHRTSQNVMKVKPEDSNARSGKGKGKGTSPVHEEEEEEEEEEVDDEQNGVQEDGEDDADGESGDEEGSPRGRKRTRLNTDGDSRPSAVKDEPVRTQPRDTDGYIPGQIVRIQLQNFLTYDFANFHCGPYLNMIIGPNGTGKSSIACAIALGLNWPPSILGRAENIYSFVKNDQDEGYVEIELKGPKGRPNLVIRRKMTSRSKANSFTLNGRPCTAKEVSSRMAQLNVQISNLCTFLPQDKVSSFAMMNPQQLLKETQKAAGNPNLTMWHESLINAGHEHRTMIQTIKDEEGSLQQMRERNDAIEKEVERYQERKRIEEQIEILNLYIPSVKYNELREEFNVAKEKQRKLFRKVSKLEAKKAPIHNLLKSITEKIQKHDRDRTRGQTATQDKFKQMQRKWKENTALESEADKLNSQIEELEVDEQRRAKRIKSIEDQIVGFEEEYNKEVKMEDQAELAAELREVNNKRREVEERIRELQPEQEEIYTGQSLANMTIDDLEKRLKQLDSEDGRKLANLKRWDADCHDVVLWLRRNRGRFKMDIIEPPYLSLTVKDQRFASAVEACFGNVQLRTFVAQCREDYDLLNNCVNEENSELGRRVRVPTWFRDHDQIHLIPPPMTLEEMHQLGFALYAIDIVECPEGLKTYLKAELQLHRVAITLSQNIDIERAMEAVARPIPNSGWPGGANFITGSILHQVTRSRYGRHARSNATINFPPARNLSAQTVDVEQKRKIESEIQEQKMKLDDLTEKQKKISEQRRALDTELDEHREAKLAIDKRVKAIKDEVARKQNLTQKIKRAKEQLKNEKNKPSADSERKRIRRKMADIAKKRAALAKEHLNLARDVIGEQTVTSRAGLENMQLEANKAVLEQICEKKDEKHRKTLDDFHKADAEYNRIKTESKRALEVARAAHELATDEHKELWNDVSAARAAYKAALKEAQTNGTEPPSDEGIDLRTADELETALEEQYAQLELITKTNPGVVEQYEKRKRDIESLEVVLEKKNREAQSLEKSINSTKSKWLPALQELVGNIGEKFSAAFERIGCAGEIRISENEDYDRWAIDILVKFRDHEKLSLLTGQRQSGGERSLTTILYLMSLTEEARTPFSLVDEINQGMDQRAERVVHNNMVEVTCKETAGQYFLITPKLLPDLNYHERMKVLCVANGEWLPEESGMGNLKSMIDGYLSLQQRKGSSKSH